MFRTVDCLNIYILAIGLALTQCEASWCKSSCTAVRKQCLADTVRYAGVMWTEALSSDAGAHVTPAAGGPWA